MRKIILFLSIIMVFCQSCAMQRAGNSPTATPENSGMDTPAAMPTPSVIIDPMKQRDTTVTVSVGEVFAVVLPRGSSTWKVDYSSILQPLTPAENMQEPGPQGWLFQAVTSGKANIRLTAAAAECNQPPCPPAPPITYTFTVEVK